jgi:hypothetical protein
MVLVGGLHFVLVPALLVRGEQRRGRSWWRVWPAVVAGGSLVVAGVGLAGASGYWLITRG